MPQVGSWRVQARSPGPAYSAARASQDAITPHVLGQLGLIVHYRVLRV